MANVADGGEGFKQFGDLGLVRPGVERTGRSRTGGHGGDCQRTSEGNAGTAAGRPSADAKTVRETSTNDQTHENQGVAVVVVGLLAQGFDVPELSFQTITGHAEDLPAKYERFVNAPTETLVDVVDIATSLLELQVEFDDLQARMDDRVPSATWLRKGIVMITTKSIRMSGR
ncbi:hypothetical protein U8335_24410 [Roseiconus lacunae]|uniref:hypothetical protein n=1 Tax=Roseiconus lacunae TaxID=2605694 RepID=UPI0030858D73|nr:hypothetical protein U8335_24410 [Stieleria sp. HD01]